MPLIQYDWCPYKERYSDTDTQREGGMETQEEDEHLQAKDPILLSP